jgi:hypothetical protein
MSPACSRFVPSKRRQVAHLDHERGHASFAALRVHLTAIDERCLTLGERDPLVIRASDPTASGNGDKNLPEASLVRANYAARLEVENVCVRFAFALGKLDRRGELGVVGPTADLFGKACADLQDLHLRIVAEVPYPPKRLNVAWPVFTKTP